MLTYTLILAAKAITEIALLALLGQWVVGVLSGPSRDGNGVYRLLQTVGRPFVALAARLCPRWVHGRHVPLVAFLLLLWAWAGVTWTKIAWCLQAGVAQCR